MAGQPGQRAYLTGGTYGEPSPVDDADGQHGTYAPLGRSIPGADDYLPRTYGDVSGYKIPGPALWTGGASAPAPTTPMTPGGGNGTEPAVPVTPTAPAEEVPSTPVTPIESSAPAPVESSAPAPVATEAPVTPEPTTPEAPTTPAPTTPDDVLPENFTLKTFIDWLSQYLPEGNARRHARDMMN
ncbi:hypothetical protein BN1723_010087 [Verticillium longisporum]|uniref:Uncharacterized protein n=1 Tax=Verticillium longisporum TaxID=100787 RepID=A0A0G4KUX0_VERLO|nr:hypothetical protein BN1723_010087 [Verticillium longisporum]